MKKAQRLIAIFGLCVGLSACGSSTVTREAPSQPTPDTTDTTDTTDTPDTPDTPDTTASQPTPLKENDPAESITPAENTPAAEPSSTLRPDNPDAAESIAKVEPAERSEDLSDELCSSDSVTQQQMNICAQQGYQRADKQLNALYQQLQGELTDSEQQALTAAEVAWIEYRDRNCTFAKNQFIGGSIAPLIYSSCLETHTLDRTAELARSQLPQQTYAAADAELNDVYAQLLAVLSQPEIEDITDIQLSWIEYRDRNCAFEILYSKTAIEESQCLARMSETRTAQLEQEIDQRSL